MSGDHRQRGIPSGRRASGQRDETSRGPEVRTGLDEGRGRCWKRGNKGRRG